MGKKNEAKTNGTKQLEGDELHDRVLTTFHAIVPRIVDVELDGLNVTALLPRTMLGDVPPTQAGAGVDRMSAVMRANGRQRAIHRETGLTGEEHALLQHVCSFELVPYAGGELVLHTRLAT
jgi:hypothetical protein